MQIFLESARLTRVVAPRRAARTRREGVLFQSEISIRRIEQARGFASRVFNRPPNRRGRITGCLKVSANFSTYSDALRGR